jgi:Lrp/AsnC family leucine-responsive transcriptional regulator
MGRYGGSVGWADRSVRVRRTPEIPPPIASAVRYAGARRPGPGDHRRAPGGRPSDLRRHRPPGRRKLERLGAIRGYRAVVDPEALGLFVTALIAVTPLDPTQADDLPERVRDFPEVQDCLSVAGEANYILKVRTKTTGDLEALIRRLREKGEVQTRTTVVLSIPFEGRPIRP